MEQRRRRRSGEVLGEPGGELIGEIVLFVLGGLPPSGPSIDLPAQEVIRATEVIEATRGRIDRMEFGEGVDDLLPFVPADFVDALLGGS